MISDGLGSGEFSDISRLEEEILIAEQLILTKSQKRVTPPMNRLKGF